MTTSRIVIGGGFAGLLTAWDALKNSESVTVIEKSGALGGAIAGVELGGVRIDSGAEAFSTMSSTMVDLVTELGLGDFLVTPAGSSPVIAGAKGLTPIPRGVMGIPASLEDLVASPALSRADYEFASAGDSAPLDALWRERSITDVVTARLGERVLRTLVAPIVSAIYGPLALECTVAAIAPHFADAVDSEGSLVAGARLVRGISPGPGSAVASLRGGLHTLIDALAQRIRNEGGTIMTSTHASALAKTPTGWRVITPGRTLEASALTLAAGPASSGILLGGLESFRELVAATHWHGTTIALVLLEDASVNSAPLGSGALVEGDWAGGIQATTHTNAKWAWIDDALAEDSHIIRFSLGQTSLTNTDALADTVDAGLRLLYGANPATVTARRTVRWSDSVIGISPGSTERGVALATLANNSGIDLAGCLVSGNGLLGITTDTLGKERA